MIFVGTISSNTQLTFVGWEPLLGRSCWFEWINTEGNGDAAQRCSSTSTTTARERRGRNRGRWTLLSMLPDICGGVLFKGEGWRGHKIILRRIRFSSLQTDDLEGTMDVESWDVGGRHDDGENGNEKRNEVNRDVVLYSRLAPKWWKSHPSSSLLHAFLLLFLWTYHSRICDDPVFFAKDIKENVSIA